MFAHLIDCNITVADSFHVLPYGKITPAEEVHHIKPLCLDGIKRVSTHGIPTASSPPSDH